MFWVSDTRAERRKTIEQFLTKEEAGIAVLLSAVHLEWVLRRAMIGLSALPNRQVRRCLEQCSGLNRYRIVWDELVRPRFKRALPDIIANWEQLQGQNGWYNLRHELVHGVSTTCSLAYAKRRIEALLKAADDVDEFCLKQGLDIFERLPVRRTHVRA